MSRPFKNPVTVNSLGLEFKGSAPVCEVAFVEYAVIEFTAVENNCFFSESAVAEDGHYDLSIGSGGIIDHK